MDEQAAVVPDQPATTILIVDDHRSFADLLAGALNTVPGMVCIGTATTAAEGVEMAIALRPSVVVMDIEMPGEDGYELLKRAAASRHEKDRAPVPAVAVTAYARTADRRRALDAGFKWHLAKPVEPSELVSAIASLMSARS